MIRARLTLLSSAFALAACATSPASVPSSPPASSNAPARDAIDLELDEVARVHGAPGPWAVAGWRMGKFALAKLGLSRQSFDLEVVHHTPHAVQYSCIADGASAVTGASPGKLNLSVVEDADAAHVATTYKKKSTGESVTLRPSASFVARFREAPRENARANGRIVMTLADADVFEEVPR